MTVWHGWVAMWVVTIGLVAGTIGFACWGIWARDLRGLIALVTLLSSFAAIPTVWVWTADYKPTRVRRPHRSDRRRLRDEQRRIDVEAEIRRMEKEAGL